MQTLTQIATDTPTKLYYPLPVDIDMNTLAVMADSKTS
jgi:hypothetical protein